ncbi:MAG: DUF2283 domain-containing protein [Chloroflexi bacterium]|nr:DUF2283 domain-containing protein [Chloroflexota bacterium]
MKISYDKVYDILYIEIQSGVVECRTIRLTDEIALNMGSDEMLVGIEIMDASEIVGRGQLPMVSLENIQLAMA